MAQVRGNKQINIVLATQNAISLTLINREAIQTIIRLTHDESLKFPRTDGEISMSWFWEKQARILKIVAWNHSKASLPLGLTKRDDRVDQA